MGVGTIHRHLRRASEELEAACETTTGEEEYLRTIKGMLDHYVDGSDDDPEAHAYPQPGALDSVQSRITDVIEEIDDESAAEHLRNARSHLLEVILSLDDRLHEGRETTADR